MKHAYPETFVKDAQERLGYYMDACMNVLHFSADEAVALFRDSHMDTFFEEGNPRFIVGRSGKELVMDSHFFLGRPEPDLRDAVLSHSPAYCAGSVLAYYQWWSNRTFAEILSKMPFQRMIEATAFFRQNSLRTMVEQLDAVMGQDMKLTAEEIRISKMMSKALRHHPEAFGIVLDAHGWTDAAELIESIRARGFAFDRDRMDKIVALNNKHRFAYSEDGTRIRASQGHTVHVDVEMPESAPPVLLYHGTLAKNCPGIEREGLRPMKRMYVHLSKDTATARLVAARRHQEIAVYEVHAAECHRDGGRFYLSANGVWQTKAVPPEYLKRIE